MITETTGNLLRADTEALVNTVNTVGVMGKGIALQFRRAYPEMFEDYRRACARGEVQIGKMHVWPTLQVTGPQYIINFPTKQHWRAPSELAYVESGLVDLIEVVKGLGVRSIAVPPLGCGNGGLDWAVVEPVIVAALSSAPDLDVRLYVPGATPPASEMATATARPEMTPGRAALVEILVRYLRNALEATPLEIQKLMYFLQVVGEPLRLQFGPGKYGPYADNLRHVLILTEGHFFTGYGDGSAKVLEAESIRPLPGVSDEAAAVLAARPVTRQRIALVDNIIDGFESMYGMELLASVHWVAVHDAAAMRDWRRAAELIRKWSPRKAEMFTDLHVERAWNRLAEHRLVGDGAGDAWVDLRQREGSLIRESVAANDAESALVRAIRRSGYSLQDIAVITGTRAESVRIQESLENEGIATVSLDEFDGTPIPAIKVGTVRRALGTEFSAVFHLTTEHRAVQQLSGPDREAAELVDRQALVAMTRGTEYRWLGIVERKLVE